MTIIINATSNQNDVPFRLAQIKFQPVKGTDHIRITNQSEQILDRIGLTQDTWLDILKTIYQSLDEKKFKNSKNFKARAFRSV